MAKKVNHWLYKGTLWLPRIILLNGLWLLGALPLVTMARATRAVVQLVDSYLHEEFNTVSVWQDFWTIYRKDPFGVKRLDGLFSAYFVLALANLWFFGHSSGTLAAFLWAFCLFLVIIGSTLFMVQTALANRSKQPVRFFTAFIYAGHHSKRLVLHWLITVAFCFGLFIIGKLFLVLGGVPLIIYLNLSLLKNRQKTAIVTEKS
jgi:uncharacterized membrane protein YesL